YTVVEEATAEVFGGICVRSKAVYDVLLPDENEPTKWCGVSCKMKNNDTQRISQGRVYVEYANADSEFLQAVAAAGFQ
ncbi:MAG: hypothetical protein WA761_08140, partial [Thermoplasmata archaeon]